MRIFLSSTYIDLVAYRAAAARALEQLGQQVGRMEVFGARPNEPVEACLGEIDKCSIFVGIYAHRYGFTPAGSQDSITEQEFNHARHRGKQVFCFIADESHPWPPQFVDNGIARERLQEFKKHIRDYYVVSTFTTEDNLASHVATSVGRYLSEFKDEPLDRPISTGIEDVLITGVAALSRQLAMLFVDLMRLLSVISSPSVRSANIDRYQEFLNMADQRLLDLRSTYILFARYLTAKLSEQIHSVDSQLSWILLRLRRGPDLDSRSRDICLSTLHEVSQWLVRLCELSLASEYELICLRVRSSIKDRCSDPARLSAKEMFEIRLKLQSDLVQHRRDLCSIIDDRHLKLAVEYFCLDHALLSMFQSTIQTD